MPSRRWPEAGLAAALLLLGLAILLPASAAGPVSPARQAELRHLLIHDCGSCHGMTMRGGLGSPLLPSALEGRSDALLVEVILGGIRGTAMPPWAGEITEDEARWMVRLLRQGGLP
ncbi:MAG: cytochrome c [Alphaproteobacteria bacterium]|nr:cytochrome c [Alphaproteobacteria bacterium]